MNEERKEELYNLWLSESDGEDEEWRETLTPEELALVSQWDDKFPL